MNFFLILFFISFFAITLMIGKKLLLINNSVNENRFENFSLDFFDLDKFKHLFIKKTKNIIHMLIWLVLRTYIISLNFINKKKLEAISKIKSKLNKYREENKDKTKEASKYIKIISEYRHKIKKMKHRIKEEEGIE